MKKISLLLVLAILFSFTCCFATEDEIDGAPLMVTTSAPVSGEEADIISNTVENVENVLESGNIDILSGDVNVQSGEIVEENDTEASRSTIWGAIFAMILVVVIVVLVAVFSKNDD